MNKVARIAANGLGYAYGGGWGGTTQCGPVLGLPWDAVVYAATAPSDFGNLPDGALLFIDFGGETLELQSWEMTRVADSYTLFAGTDKNGIEYETLALAGAISAAPSAQPSWFDVQAPTAHPDTTDYTRGYRIGANYLLPIGWGMQVFEALQLGIKAVEFRVVAQRADGTTVSKSCAVPVALTQDTQLTSNNVGVVFWESPNIYGVDIASLTEDSAQLVLGDSSTAYAKNAGIGWDAENSAIFYSWADFNTNKHDIMRYVLGAGGPTTIIAKSTLIAGLGFHGGFVYYHHQNAQAIRRVNVSTLADEEWFDFTTVGGASILGVSSTSITVGDDGTVYVTTSDGIYRITQALDASKVADFAYGSGDGLVWGGGLLWGVISDNTDPDYRKAYATHPGTGGQVLVDSEGGILAIGDPVKNVLYQRGTAGQHLDRYTLNTLTVVEIYDGDATGTVWGLCFTTEDPTE